jgi:two-component system OmpR family sensor kinase
VSLRVRLVAGLAALVLFGLAAFGVGTYVALDHFLVGRVDQQLSAGAAAVASSLYEGPGGHDGQAVLYPATVRTVVGPDIFVELLGADGTALASVPAQANSASAPKFPSGATVPSDGSAHVFTTASAGHGAERAAVLQEPGTGLTIVLAQSLHPVTQTLHRLLMVELAVGALALLVTLALGLWLAHQAAAPLEEIATTADAIAAGELGRRVDGADDRSEVGRVGVAFNSMLNEIEGAFRRRDASEERLRRFVVDASHELSTPITSIRGYAELFHRGLAERPVDLAKAMERIEAEGARMGALVDDLLSLASLDNGQPLRRDPVDLAQIVIDTGTDLRATAPERSITIDAPTPVWVVGDENRLRQVAANLATNARRHTPAGTPILLRARSDGATGVLAVADAGPGLAPDVAAHVFDRFYRADQARSRAAGGTGLGLSIVAAIAEALGGRASLVTSEGAGATFSVAIPLVSVGPPGGESTTPADGRPEAAHDDVSVGPSATI